LVAGSIPAPGVLNRVKNSEERKQTILLPSGIEDL